LQVLPIENNSLACYSLCLFKTQSKQDKEELMKESLHKSKYQTIPIEIKEEDFNKYIMPHLSMPKRGPKCKIGYWKVYNYIARIDHTGEQWDMLKIDKGKDGKPEIHYTSIYRYFARWSDDGSFERSFIASVEYLAKEGRLDLSVLHGDGTNTIAKKGVILSAIPAISTKKERKLLR
jgi:hypothetical protein